MSLDGDSNAKRILKADTSYDNSRVSENEHSDEGYQQKTQAEEL